MRRLGLVLLLVTFFGLSPAAFASFSFFVRPLKAVTCELMLRSRAKDFSVDANVLPSLREAVYVVRDANREATRDGVTYQDVAYSGPIAAAGTAKAEMLLQRLNGLEDDLTTTNLDGQVGLEFRGADIQKALAAIEQNEAAVRSAYQEKVNQSFPFQARVVGSLLSGFLGVGTLLWIRDLPSDLLRNDIISVVLDLASIGALTYFDWWNAYKVERSRLDWNYNSLKSVLKRITTTAPGDEFYMASASISVPVEFNRMLTNDKLDSSAVEQGRVAAVDTMAAGFFLGIGRLLTAPSEFSKHLERFVTNAGDNTRKVFVDHVVYFDKAKNEPVWLYFYRSYRSQRTGRPPKQKIAPHEFNSKLEWEPALTPVPVRSR